MPRPGVATLLILAGAAWRLALLLRARVIEHDGYYYTELARAWLNGNPARGLSPIWPPLYPLLIAGAGLPFAVSNVLVPQALEWSARAVSLAAGVLTLVLLHRWSRVVTNPRVALLALAIAAFHPRLVQYSASALTESTFVALLLAGLLLLAENPEPAPLAREGAAGIAFGLATLARPEGLPLGLAAWIGLCLARPRRFHQAFLVALALTILPWVVFASGVEGRLSIGEKGAYNFWRGYQTEYRARFGDPPGLSRRVFDAPDLARAIPPARVEVLGLVRAEPGRVAARTLRNLVRILVSSLPLATTWPVLVLALAGLPLLAAPRARPMAALLILTPLLYAPFGDDQRFLVPMAPGAIALAAAGAERLAAWRGVPRPRWASALVAALALGFALAIWIRPPLDRAPEHRAAGEWLRREWPDRSAVRTGLAPGEPSPRPIVMSRKTWVAFYGAGLVAELPPGGVDSLLDRARLERADYVVVDERWGVPNRPELAALLDPRRAPPAWRAVFRVDQPPRLVLYELPPTGSR